MAKQVIFGEDVRRALKKGVDVLANAVRVTLGPKVIPSPGQKWGAPPSSMTASPSPRKSSCPSPSRTWACSW